MPGAPKDHVVSLLFKLIAVHRVVIVIEQRRKPGVVGLRAAGALLRNERAFQQGREFSKAL